MSNDETKAQEQAESSADVAGTTESAETADNELGSQELDELDEPARWRRKVREVETTRDALAEKVAALQLAQLDTMLTGTGVKPAAVLAVAELAALLDEDGLVDSGKVNDAVAAARARFGIGAPKGTVVPGLGQQPSGVPRVDAWQDAFSPRRR